MPPHLGVVRPAHRSTLALVAVVAAACATPALADVSPAGNLVVNPSFASSTSGWAVAGGTLRVAAAPPCDAYCNRTGWDGGTLGDAASTAGTASTLTVTGSPATVSSTTAGQGYLAAALVSAGAAQTVGKTVRISLRETTSTGSLVKEWSNTATLGQPWSDPTEVATGSTMVRSGDRLTMRVSLLGALAGDHVWVDRISVRLLRRVLGSTTAGTAWAKFGGDVTRINSPIGESALINGFAPLTSGAGEGYVSKVFVYVDGKGGATGTQKLRAVVYGAPSDYYYEGGWLVASTNEVAIASGSSARWVAFVFPHPVRVDNIYTLYGLGVQSSGPSNVARWAYASGGRTEFAQDSYLDGPARSMPFPEWLTQPWTMSAYAVGAQTSIYGCTLDPSGSACW